MTDRQQFISKISEIPDFTSKTPGFTTQKGKKYNFPNLNQSSYDFNSHIFPADLGQDDNGHYAVFNINVQTGLAASKASAGKINAVAGNFAEDFTDLKSRSKVDQLRTGDTNSTAQLAALGGSGNAGAVFLPRSTTRIAESIALFMPTPLAFHTHNVYEEISLSALVGGKLGVGVQRVLGGISGFFGGRLGALGTVLNATGNAAGTIAKLAQAPINPLVEILFSTTAVRQFTFEVLMAPRNEVESEAARNIIRAFRFHAAPEIGALLGLLWIPPAEFDITFFNKGTENPNIIRINTCVLERIEVDYAPASGIYSTFRNGHPVAIRLSLGFRELEPIHKRRVTQGF